LLAAKDERETACERPAPILQRAPRVDRLHMASQAAERCDVLTQDSRHRLCEMVGHEQLGRPRNGLVLPPAIPMGTCLNKLAPPPTASNLHHRLPHMATCSNSPDSMRSSSTPLPFWSAPLTSSISTKLLRRGSKGKRATSRSRSVGSRKVPPGPSLRREKRQVQSGGARCNQGSSRVMRETHQGSKSTPLG
jgi:hypothetical protein